VLLIDANPVPIAPVSDYITYEPRVFTQEEWPSNVTYFTKPNQKVDQNWHNAVESEHLGRCSSHAADTCFQLRNEHWSTTTVHERHWSIRRGDQASRRELLWNSNGFPSSTLPRKNSGIPIGRNMTN
jgi:hypothetical protein